MANFTVAARTLVHLGAELITSDEVALNELIKNAFDAESPRVKINFTIPFSHTAVTQLVTSFRQATTSAKFKLAILYARNAVSEVVSKQKKGPDREDLEKKLPALERAKSPEEAIAVIESLNYITIEDTGTGMGSKTLESVFLTIGTPSKLEQQRTDDLGRKILGNKGIGRLAMMRLGSQAKVTTWQSKTKAHEIDFDWRQFDDASKEVSDIELDVVAVKPARQTPSGTVIVISALKSSWDETRVREKFVGEFVRRLQNPFAQLQANEVPSFPIDVYVNGSARIPVEGMKKELTDLLQADFELVFNPKGVDDKKEFILKTVLTDHQRGKEPIKARRTITDVNRKIESTADELNSIGPFKVFIRWFNRDKLREQASLHGTANIAKAELNIWSGGIAIYRDGFRVGFTGQSTAEDWLGLDSSALKRSGFTLNRIQVVGALEISRAANPRLVDRSNREGLIESRESTLVRELILNFAVAEFRRYIDHEGSEEKREKLDAIVESAPVSIRERAEQAEQGLMEIRANVPSDMKKTVQSIAQHLHFIKSEVKNFEAAAKQAGERREEILELAGVGTVMAGVLHELTRTTGHTRQLLQQISKSESPKTKELLDKLDAEIKAINTRLRQLDPLTPSGRHRKEDFDLGALLRTIIRGYDARFERHEIRCDFEIAGHDQDAKVMVKMVRGFVSLAIENLMTNSVYWLQQGLKAGEKERVISIELDPKSKTLSLRDNGPGISPADKDRIFTAGFSMRPRGQGLGLFIAAEVATYHGARLILDTIDDDDRYRGFVLELPRE